MDPMRAALIWMVLLLRGCGGEGGEGGEGGNMKAVVEIELIRLTIHNNDGKIAEAIESAGGMWSG